MTVCSAINVLGRAKDDRDSLLAARKEGVGPRPSPRMTTVGHWQLPLASIFEAKDATTEGRIVEVGRQIHLQAIEPEPAADGGGGFGETSFGETGFGLAFR
jgi:hypothetical protein